MKRSVLRQLKRRKYDVCMITTRHPAWRTRIYHRETTSLHKKMGLRVLEIYIAKEEKFVQDPVCDILFLKAVRGSVILTLGKLFRAVLATRAKVFHIHDFEAIAYIPFLKLKGAKVIYDVHEDFILLMKHLKGWEKGPIPKVARVFERIFSKMANELILVTTEHIPKFRKYGIKRKKMTLVRNFVKIEDYTKAKGKKEYDMVYCGGANKHRKLDAVVDYVEAYKKQKPKVLLIISGMKSETDAVVSLVKKKKLEKYIELKVKIPASEIAQHIVKGKMGILFFSDNPKYREGIPLKITEYSAVKIPILASKNNNFSIQYITKHNCGYLLDNLTPENIRKGELYIKKHQKELSANAFKAVKQYSWETEEKASLNYINEFLKGRGKHKV